MQCGIKNILICTRLEILLVWESSRRSAIDLFCPTFIVISEEAHQCGRGVLVHCQAGVSRSATIVIAYLMKHTLMTMTDAYKYVRGRRPVVSPNLNFMGQLLEFERDLNSGVTPRILTPKLSGLETQVWKIQAEDYCEKNPPMRETVKRKSWFILSTSARLSLCLKKIVLIWQLANGCLCSPPLSWYPVNDVPIFYPE